MFKAVPQNQQLLASLEGVVVEVLSDESHKPIEYPEIELFINSVPLIRDKQWVGYLAHYELELPQLSRHLVQGIIFKKHDQRLVKSIADVIPVFPQPIYALPDSRVIPTNPRYAISQDGDVFDLFEQRPINVYYPKSKKHYPTVYIYDPDRGIYRGLRVHRLIALAWIPNDDYVNKFQVNHIDGIKANHELSNLEWVSPSGNSHHAFQTGLREDNVPCKIRSAITGIVQHFHSQGEIQRQLGIKAISTVTGYLSIQTKHKLLLGEYELKFEDDDTPWFYEKHKLGARSGRYILTVTHANGVVEEEPDLRNFVKKYNLWNTPGIDNIIEKAKSLYPGMSVSYVDNYVVSEVQAKNVITGEVLVADGIRPMCRITGIEFNDLRTTLKSGKVLTLNRQWMVRYCSNEPWPNSEELIRLDIPISVTVTHGKTGETIQFKSLRETAAHFGVDRSLIKNRIKNKDLWNDWSFQ